MLFTLTTIVSLSHAFPHLLHSGVCFVLYLVPELFEKTTLVFIEPLTEQAQNL